MIFGGSWRITPMGLAIFCSALLAAIYLSYHINLQAGQSASQGTVSLKQLLIASVEMAKLGGHQVRAVRQEVDMDVKSKGGKNNLVTDGDMKSHRVMYYGLKKTFPGLRVISEETDPEAVDMDTIEAATLSDAEFDDLLADVDDVLVAEDQVDVWIDPLDATQEYTENLLQYVTTMVCVAVAGEPLIGVIHKPFQNITAWGWAGKNLLSPSLKTESNNPDVDSVRRIIVSRSHAGAVHQLAEAAFGQQVEITPAGGAGFKAWEVAVGNQDAYIHATLIKKWDICPGDAILSAAGGKLTTMKGQEIEYSGNPPHVTIEDGIVAAVHNHDQLVHALQSTP